jgi:hypothetical protein
MTTFDAEPPTITIRGEKRKLRPFGRGVNRILANLSDIEDEAEKASAFVVAFAAVNSLDPPAALDAVSDKDRFERAVGEADMELSSEDLSLVDQYLAGVFERANAAAVTVDKSPGKAQGEVIPQAATPLK